MMQIELFQLLTLFDSSICLCTTYTNTLTPSPSSTWQHEESHCDWRQQQWPNFTVLKQLVIASSDVAIDNCPDHVVLRFACLSIYAQHTCRFICAVKQGDIVDKICGVDKLRHILQIWKTVAQAVQMVMLLSLIMILLSSIRSIIMLLFSMTRTMMLLSSVMTIIANGRFELADWFGCNFWE